MEENPLVIKRLEVQYMRLEDNIYVGIALIDSCSFLLRPTNLV